MARTPVDLFRAGNTAGPRLDRVRPNWDIAVYQLKGADWGVRAGAGGGIHVRERQTMGQGLVAASCSNRA